MDLEKNTDLIYQIGLWLGVAIIATICVLMIFVTILRLKLLYSNHRSNNFLNTWQPLLESASNNGLPDILPAITRLDRFKFLALWIQCYENHSNNEESLGRLRTLLTKTGMVTHARKMIRTAMTRSRLTAVIALGYLQNEQEWDELHKIASSPDPFISLVAAHALVHIDKTKATPIFIDLIKKHLDWPATKVASILETLGPELITEALIDMILSTSSEQQAALIPYLSTCEKEATQSVVHKILQTTENDSLIAPCLKVLAEFGDKQDLSTIRSYLNHELWHIRVQAAICIGKTGNIEDEGALLELLRDKHWWVRYRAAQALAKLPFVDRQKLLDYKNTLDDNYGKDILTQIIAETDSNHHD